MTLQWNGPAVTALIRQAAARAVEETGDELLARANETVPFDTGTLAASGQVDVNPARVTATVSYNTPYAIRQHEDTNLSHPNPLSPNSSPNGRARWLELTAIENQRDFHTWIATRLKGAV